MGILNLTVLHKYYNGPVLVPINNIKNYKQEKKGYFMKNNKHYIVLRIEDNQVINSGFDYTDYLPQGNKPGKWTPKIPAAKTNGSEITYTWEEK